jgi:hypothetical protein
VIDDELITCPVKPCVWRTEVSAEDPDSSLSLAVNHVRSHGFDIDEALRAIHGLDEAPELQNREAWLIKAAEAMVPWFEHVGEKVPPIRVSVGWAGGRQKNAVGQCWASTACADGVPQIFVTPARGKNETVDVLGTLLHEMIHAIDDCESGHRGNFIRIARAMGLLPKWTSSMNRTEELTDALKALAEQLGEFPQAAIGESSRGSEQGKAQKNRQLKFSCRNTGYIVRTSRKWADVGAPLCPCCQAEMQEEEK